MPSKFVTSWKLAGGQVTPAVREIGAAYDNLMPLILAGGAAIGPAGLAIAQGIAAESDSASPLFIARLSPPGNVFPAVVVPSMVAAMGQLSVSFLTTFTPPTPVQALGAWMTTPAGQLTTSLPPPLNASALTLATAMSTYMSGAFIGGIGDPGDAPPPPPPAGGYVQPALVPTTALFGYYNNTDAEGADLLARQLRFYPFVLPRGVTYTEQSKQLILSGARAPLPREVVVYAWQFDDPSGPTNLGSTTLTAFGPYSFPEDPNYSPGYTTRGQRVDVDWQFPAVDTYDVVLTVCNASSQLSETRSAYSG